MLHVALVLCCNHTFIYELLGVDYHPHDVLNQTLVDQYISWFVKSHGRQSSRKLDTDMNEMKTMVTSNSNS